MSSNTTSIAVHNSG